MKKTDAKPSDPKHERRCIHCGGIIDREKLLAELQRIDIPETSRRAARISVYCKLHCAFEAFGAGAS